MKLKRYLGFLSVLTIAIVVERYIWKCINNSMKAMVLKEKKFRGYYNMMNYWIYSIQNGQSIGGYLNTKGYRSVAIYGMGEIGERLLADLKQNGVCVEYAIDRNSVAEELKIYSPNDELPEVDVIIVTVPHVYSSVKKQLKISKNTEVVNIEQIIYDL